MRRGTCDVLRATFDVRRVECDVRRETSVNTTLKFIFINFKPYNLITNFRSLIK